MERKTHIVTQNKITRNMLNKKYTKPIQGTLKRPQSKLDQMERRSMFLDRRLKPVIDLRSRFEGGKLGFYLGHVETDPSGQR